jgi:hypothetical protein
LRPGYPRDAVDDAVEATGKRAKRKGGKLPPHVMVYFAMGLALFAEEDYEEVWSLLSETLSDWGCWDPAEGAVTTGGLTQARQRLGHEPVKEVFRQVAVPPAPGRLGALPAHRPRGRAEVMSSIRIRSPAPLVVPALGHGLGAGQLLDRYAGYLAAEYPRRETVQS